MRMQFSTLLFPKLALWLSLSGLAIGLTLSYLVTPQYVSNVVARTYDLQGLTTRYNTITGGTSLAALIQDPHLGSYPEELSNRPLNDVVREMRRNLRFDLSPRGNGALVHLLFRYRDPRKAQFVMQAIVAQLKDRGSDLKVIDPPNLPYNQMVPNRRNCASAGFIVGFVAAILLALYRRFFFPTKPDRISIGF